MRLKMSDLELEDQRSSRPALRQHNLSERSPMVTICIPREKF